MNLGAQDPIDNREDKPSRADLAGKAVDQHNENSAGGLQGYALSLLGALRVTHDRARLHHLHYMRLARAYGCSTEDIAGALGVSEAAVRAMLNRTAGDQH